MDEQFRSLRIRNLNAKGQEQFDAARDEYESALHTQWTMIQNLISNFSPSMLNIEYIDNYEQELSKAYTALCTKSNEYMTFLTQTRTDDSMKYAKDHSEAVGRCKKIIENATKQSDEARQKAIEVASQRSRGSGRNSVGSSASSVTARKRAKAEAARAKLKFAEQELALKKEQAALIEQEKNLRASTALATRKDFAVAAAEAEVLETDDIVDKVPERSLANLNQLGKDDPIERTRQYVQDQTPLLDIGSQPNVVRSSGLNVTAPSFRPQIRDIKDQKLQSHPSGDQTSSLPRNQTCNLSPDSMRVQTLNPIHNQTFGQSHEQNLDSPSAQTLDQLPDRPYECPTHCSGMNNGQIHDLTKFLLKKDMLISRLSCFNDRPETYAFWKSQFKGIICELSASDTEELDLLSKWLGPHSSKYALSIRSANVLNPKLALARIWERLDERFGSPEMLESVLKTKLSNFPRLTNKDNLKLYELLDILCEIESLMVDPKYQSLLGYYNSSSGVSPIISKLPFSIQEKWTTHAHRYKSARNVSYPPFTCLVEFIRDVAKMKNDPGLSYSETANITAFTKDRNGPQNIRKQPISVNKTLMEVKPEPQKNEVKWCPLHNVKQHTLNECRKFREKPFEERRRFLREKFICFKCCNSDQHKSQECHEKTLCEMCGSKTHSSAMHIEQKHPDSHGGERTDRNVKEPTAITKCTQICKQGFSGKSCAKVVLVTIHSSDNPNKSMRSYAILDEQSSDTLVNYSVFDALGITGPTTDYILTSCAGVVEMSGRMAEGLVVTSLDESFSIPLPTVLECDYIPNIRDEIPSREVVKYHAHLQDLVQVIPEIDENVPISILIGRDVPDAHSPVLDQRTGPRNSPYAQKLPLGWVVVGETCLHKVHPPSNITVNKTFILPNGRGSICEPCPNAFEIQGSKSSNNQSHVKSIENLDNSIFMKCRDDDSVGLSVDDKEFLKLMNQHAHQNLEGNWEAPLPFRTPRQRLPNNRSLALKRAMNLDASLRKDENKRKHFFEFMEKVFERKHAEVAMPLSKDDERWYLPIFGVYHPRKPNQLRAVFDSSSKFENVSLNDVLLSGPDLNNKLLGVLLRFRKEPIAATADIESMFHCFIVNHEHRKFLRFFWYEGNDFHKDLVEYQMRVHVFGNCPSPSVATYCLRKAASVGEQAYGSDVVEFVDRCFYVDDGLISLPTTEEAIDLLHRSKEALRTGGNLRLHKIASNSKEVMDAFEPQDRAKAFKDIDLCVDNLPTQQSLGLNWELDSDSFKFKVSSEEKPFTKRGLLSTVNGIYDPIGFVAPAVVTGKLLLREITSGPYDWDDSLPTDMLGKWMDWTRSLISLENLNIPRCYSPAGLRAAVEKELHVFSDASEQAIAAVVYLRTKDTVGNYHVGFVLGKAKVAPPHGHTIPRLELCAAVLAVQLSEVVLEELDIDVDKTRFYTDSQVVLGYICNQSKRFYKYVENRVERIRKTTTPQQWSHVRTKVNPADSATRTVNNIHNSIWILGPPQLLEPELDSQVGQYPLLEPDKDSEIRQGTNVNVFKSTVESTSDVFRIRHRIERFSEWNSLVKAIDRLKSLAKKFRQSTEIEQSISLTTEQRIIQMVQRESFSTEMECIEKRKLFPRNSNISNLNPFIDQHGLLRVGGRLSRAEIDLSEKHPIILPKNHHISVLLIRRFHVSVKHQGRHFTAGAIRAAGYWIVGEKRLIASILHKCVRCRKLRGKCHQQLMSDLPQDRLQPTPPFTYIGIDTFGPWSIVTRKTRGGQANSKRWAVLFTCLYTRAIHIEVIEELSSSSFINCLRRFISLRGCVKEIRSDRGTNFIGATDDLGVNVVNVETGPTKHFLDENKVTWIFNSPHSSHMGGVWERMIGITRRILDSMLMDIQSKHLTHEVLTTLMAEVCAIVNSRPIAPVSTDPESPTVLSPAALLTQKTNQIETNFGPYNIKDLYKSQWRCVQHLANIFWQKWRKEYLQNQQVRRKWKDDVPNLKEGDIVLVNDCSVARNEWPVGIIVNAIKSLDGKVRKAEVRIFREGKRLTYTRPITELVLLLHQQ